MKEVKTIIIDDIFTFEEFLEIKNYKAIDFNGREVILKINGNRIDATNLNKGIYFLFIETENENRQFKINKIN